MLTKSLQYQRSKLSYLLAAGVLLALARRYTTTLKSMIPLPDPNAPPGSPSSLDVYPQHREGATVLALYPDTSCFYRAKVLAGPTHKVRWIRPNQDVTNTN